MMLNPLPHPDATIPAILDFLATAHRYGTRNRCLYRLRLIATYKDITAMRMGDVLTRSGGVQDAVTLASGAVLAIDAELAADLLAYIRERYGYDLVNLMFIKGHEPLFSTQKSPRFSPGWLGQLYTHLDRSVRAHYTSLQQRKRRSS